MSKFPNYAASRPHPGKDHDRFYISPDEQTFAVFDGAGDDAASNFAQLFFAQHHPRTGSTLTPENRLARLFRDTQNFLISSVGGRILTTGTALSLQSIDGGLSASYAHAGDSRLYAYKPGSQLLERLTTDESERLPTGQIDAHNFLGSRHHILRQLGTYAMPADTRFLLVTDGFVDEYYEGYVPDERIAEILGAAATPQAAVQELQAACSVPDDATAVAVFGRT